MRPESLRLLLSNSKESPAFRRGESQTQVSIGRLKHIHEATHSGAMLETKKPASTSAITHEVDEESLQANLLTTLDAETEAGEGGEGDV